MLYRRYGKTELQMPVLTCGGMRYQQSWNGSEIDKITADNQANLAACLHHALASGITHIETARGYGTSEYQIGRVMPDLPRDQFILQTKIGPTQTGEEFRQYFAESLERLQTDYVDLLSIHGVNNTETLTMTLDRGALDVCEELKAQGKVRHIGFSTHGPVEVIRAAIATGRFEYVNLHWFWIMQDRWAAIADATERDMGVFIISPNNKGGLLYEPSQKLTDLCAPMTPMEWNDCYCLLQGQVHTLSIGVARPSDFDAHLRAVEWMESGRAVAAVETITQRLDSECRRVLGDDWWENWQVGLPSWQDVPGEFNVVEILRLYNFTKALDMVEFGKMRYNLFGGGGHWFPGKKIENLDELDREGIVRACSASPFAERIPDILVETHHLLAGEEVKRLQQDD